MSKFIFALLTFVFFILYTGILNELTLLTGVLIAIAITALVDEVFIKKEISLRDVARLASLIKYLAYFLVVEIREHATLSRLVLSSRLSVSPEIVHFPVDVSSDYALTAIAHTITNTPGTFTLHVDREKKVIYVHWLLPKCGDSVTAKKHIVGYFEELIKSIFE